MANYKNLEAWKLAMNVVKGVYTITKKFPKEKLYGLTSQTKRAAVAIPANIAEGLGRQYKKDTLQFLYISKRSLYELETLINIAVMVKILSNENCSLLTSDINHSLKVLNGLINSYELREDLK